MINLKDTSSHVSVASLSLDLSPEYSLNFLSNLYISQWFEQIFKMHFQVKIVESRHFIHDLRQKYPSGFNNHLQGRGKLLISPIRKEEGLCILCLTREKNKIIS